MTLRRTTPTVRGRGHGSPIRGATAALLIALVWPSGARANPEPAAAEGPSEGLPAPMEGSPALPEPVAPPLDIVPSPAEPPAPLPPPSVRFPQHFLFGNGLSLLLTRLSVGYEYLHIAHHSLGVNIHGQYGGGIASGLLGVKGAFVGLGGELGYRFYAWRDGPFGPFFGLSFLAGVYHTQATVYKIDPNAFRFVQYGPAIDFGWSVHLDRTTVLALALGAQYTLVSVDPHRLNELTHLVVGEGLRPRGQIQVGKTF